MDRPFRILVASRSFASTSSEPKHLLEQAGCKLIENPYGRTLTEEELLQLIPGFHGLIAGIDPITQVVVAAADQLKMISVHGAGTDQIDLGAATKRGIVVANVPGVNAYAVAELTMGLILALLRRIPTAVEMTKAGEWKRLLGTGLAGKTLGIVGLGNIGQAVARMAQGFGLKLLGYTPHPKINNLSELGVVVADLKTVISSADILTLHVPLTEETRGLVNKERFLQMKPGAFLINTSRGEVVDEEALAEALCSGRLSGAALDVLREEPPAGNPLLKLDNCLITPHMASFTHESISQMSEIAAQNLLQFLKGLPPTYCVNPEIYK